MAQLNVASTSLLSASTYDRAIKEKVLSASRTQWSSILLWDGYRIEKWQADFRVLLCQADRQRRAGRKSERLLMNRVQLPQGNWIRIINLGYITTEEELQTWLAERGICLPIEHIWKPADTHTAVVCFTNKDIENLVTWLIGTDPFPSDRGATRRPIVEAMKGSEK